MKRSSHSLYLLTNFVDMSNVIHHIYSSVENGRYKLREAEQFVIKLFYIPLSSTAVEVNSLP